MLRQCQAQLLAQAQAIARLENQQQQQAKQARLQPNAAAATAFDKDEIMSHVLAFVGPGSWLFIASINRRWKTLYETYVLNQGLIPIHTLRSNSITSMTRFFMCCRLGMFSDPTFDADTFAVETAQLITEDQFRMAVDYDMPTSKAFIDHAAWCVSISQMSWMTDMDCPYTPTEVLNGAVLSNSTDVLEWLGDEDFESISSADVYKALQFFGVNANTAAAASLFERISGPICCAPYGTYPQTPWSRAFVSWALEHGWRWPADCDTNLRKYMRAWRNTDDARKWKQLFVQAHEDAGCTCTCPADEAETLMAKARAGL